MSQRGLEALLRPASIAVIGASNKPGRAGYLMMQNLMGGNSVRPIMPVTPKYKAVGGVLAWKDVQSLPFPPDLAIVCTNPDRNLELINQLGEKGCKACVILSAPRSQFDALKAYACKWQIRLLGPNSLGVLAPWQALNASFSPIPIQKGNLAFISQSASVSNIVLDWAKQRQLGFSWFISLGDSLDIDVDDLLDFLARDAKTSAILLYLEQLSDARRFVSAARSASRNKPILVIKSGRTPEAQALLGSSSELDAVWDAVIQRAGLLRVQDMHELFSAVETLSHMRPLRGERLMIVSNGIAPAVLALDELQARAGRLAVLTDETREALCACFSAKVVPNNPLNLNDDATPEYYSNAVSILLNDKQIDALLIIHSPSAVAPGAATAQVLISLIDQHPRGKKITLLTNWCGEYSSLEARLAFSEAKIPTYRTPEGAITAFMHMVEYHRNQKQLRETPSLPVNLKQDASRAHEYIKQALQEGKRGLDTHEAKHILQVYGLVTLPAWIANNGVEAVHIAEEIGYPVALKLRSPDVIHKSQVQGVMLNLYTPEDVQKAADAIFYRTHIACPQAHIEGLLVQSMAKREDAHELRIVAKHDSLFGPVIILSEAGVDWRTNPVSVALPPLNMTLARHLVNQAIKRKIISVQNLSYSLDIHALSQVLVQVSHLVVNCPEIQYLDIQPLLAVGKILTVLDVNMTLAPFSGSNEARLAIRPYPRVLEEKSVMEDGTGYLLRPILPEDEPLLKHFISRVTKEDLYYRYFSEITEFTHEDLANMTQIDYDREMAIVAVLDTGSSQEILGVTRAISDVDNVEAEFSVLVRSDLKGLGLGRRLLQKMISYARTHGIQQLNGITMPANQGMIILAKKLGFKIDVQLEHGIVNLILSLKHSGIDK